MTTEQSYVGRGNYATTSPQTANNQAVTPLLADNLPELAINPRIYEAQTRLLDLADGFVTIGYEHGPLQAINRLLVFWLTTPVDKLSKINDPNQLHCALLLIDFLNELYGANYLQGVED